MIFKYETLLTYPLTFAVNSGSVLKNIFLISHIHFINMWLLLMLLFINMWLYVCQQNTFGPRTCLVAIGCHAEEARPLLEDYCREQRVLLVGFIVVVLCFLTVGRTAWASFKNFAVKSTFLSFCLLSTAHIIQ